MPRKSGAFFTHVRKSRHLCRHELRLYCPSRSNHLLTRRRPSSFPWQLLTAPPQRLATDRRCVLKLLAFDDAPTNAMLPRVSLSLLPFARGHRPHLGGRDLEDLLAILSGCRREIARRHHCCPDKKHTHAGVAQFTGSELRKARGRISFGMESPSFVRLNWYRAE